MDPSDFVAGIPLKAEIDTDSKPAVVAALRMFYCRFFAGDRTDGSSFDCQVLDALDLILEYPELWELKRANRAQRDRGDGPGPGINRTVDGTSGSA